MGLNMFLFADEDHENYFAIGEDKETDAHYLVDVN